MFILKLERDHIFIVCKLKYFVIFIWFKYKAKISTVLEDKSPRGRTAKFSETVHFSAKFLSFLCFYSSTKSPGLLKCHAQGHFLHTFLISINLIFCETSL